MTGPERLAIPEAGMDVSLRWDGPVGDAPLLVFGHGAGAGIDHPLIFGFAAAFAQAGVATLRYQFPFMERQGGTGFGRDSMPVALAAVGAAVLEAGKRSNGQPVFAGGHSYGARMTTHAALEGPVADVAGLVLLSFPLHQARAPSTERAEHLASLHLPMLFMSGSRDAMADPALLTEVVAGLSDATLQSVEGADHGWKAARRVWPDGVSEHVAAQVAAFVETRSA